MDLTGPARRPPDAETAGFSAPADRRVTGATRHSSFRLNRGGDLVLYGAGYGAGRILIPTLVREFYGVHSFAAIMGLMNGVMSLAGIVGAPLAGRLYDVQGSYSSAWLIIAALMCVSFVLMATTPKPSLELAPQPSR